jgi:hypothetical protein
VATISDPDDAARGVAPICSVSCFFALYIQVDSTSCRTVRMLFLGNSPYSTEQFAVQRNENILTKIVQNKLVSIAGTT